MHITPFTALLAVYVTLLTLGCASSPRHTHDEPVSAPDTARAQDDVMTDPPRDTLPPDTSAQIDEIEGRALARLTRPMQPLLSASLSVAQVKARLDEMVDIDQEVRQAVGEMVTADLGAEQAVMARTRIAQLGIEVDEAHYQELEPYLKAQGWPLISVFGEAASHNVWLLVQHADQHRDFQRWALDHMEPLMASGEVTPSDYAYLWDRVAMGEGRPQRYGTQGQCVARDTWEPHTLEDPVRVDELRSSVGLEPLADYRQTFIGVCDSDQRG